MPFSRTRSGVRLWLVLVVVAALGVGPAHAQSWPDSVRTPALRDFHGPDMKGKDGPLAKAGLDLLLLYHAHRQDVSPPPSSSSPVRNGHVTIDAIAATDVQALRRDLTNLGLKGAAAAGRIVSGRFPVARVPDLARLASLQGVTIARAQTWSRSGTGRGGEPQASGRDARSPRTEAPAAPSPTRPADSAHAPPKQVDPAPVPTASPSATGSPSVPGSGDAAMGLLALLAAVALGLDGG